MTRRAAGTALAPIGWVLAATTAGYLAVAMVIVVLPRYMTERLGGGPAQVGLAVGCFAVAAVAVRPLAGLAADRHGVRVTFLAGLALIAAGGAVYPFASAREPVVLLAAQVLLGLGRGIMLTAATVWVVDVAPPGRGGWAIGIVGLVNYVVLAAGGVAGPVLTAWGGYGLLWVAVMALPLAGIAAGVVAAAPGRTAADAASPPGGSPPHVLDSLRLITGPGVSLALGFAGYAALTGFAVVMLDGRGVAGASAVLTAYAAGVIATRLLAGGLPDRLGVRPALVLGFGAEAAGLIVIAAAGLPPVALAGGALMGAGMSLIYPALGLRVLRRVEGSPYRKTAFATFGAFLDIGVAVGGPVLGLVAGAFGYPAAFAVAAGAVTAGLVVQLPSRGQENSDARRRAHTA